MQAPMIQVGSIFIKEGTLLAASLQMETESYSDGWRLLSNLDGYGVQRKAHAAGWNFFLLAGGITAISFGPPGEKRTRRAAGKIMARLTSLKFNCVEVSQVVAKRFLGLPYVCVTAHSRHIGEGDDLREATQGEAT